MSNPTDTNQASKDGIRDLLRIIDIESGDEPDSYWIDESSIEKATAAIQELIRTEKLKLLAEVRERERSYSITDLELLEHQTGDDEVIAVPVSEITKLEAEL